MHWIAVNSLPPARNYDEVVGFMWQGTNTISTKQAICPHLGMVSSISPGFSMFNDLNKASKQKREMSPQRERELSATVTVLYLARSA